MASADDPLANAYNIMGAEGLTNPNPYLEYQGQIPMAGFMGVPTNAQGQPIGSYLQAMAQQTPGTTLNSAPAAAPQTAPVDNSMLNAMGLQASQQLAAESQFGGRGGTMPYSGAGAMFSAVNNARAAQNPGAGAAAPVPAAAAPTGAPNMRQAYLDALSNPGPVATPGAVMQPGATPTGGPQPSVLAAFLAAHPSGGSSVPGGYSNQSFFNTLANLQAAKGASA